MNKTTSILVVDDDRAILQVYSKILRPEGYEVWEASTGREGFQMALERRPDVVLLDVMLPDLSGTEVCRQIKAEAALAGVFVVLVSGTALSAAEKVDGLDMGADDYLPKPLELAEFLARIRAIVRLQNTTAALRASEQRYRELVEIMPDAVLLVDPQGRFLAVNPQAVAMFGYPSQAELLQKSVFDLTLLEDRARLEADIATVLKTGSVRDVEYTVVGKDGHRFPAEVRSAVAKDASGHAVSLVVVVRDITERNKTEAGLRQLSRSILEAQETERQRVARDLHDSVNQVIASAKMRVHRVAQMAMLNPAARELLARCDELLVQALEENRRIAHNLRPTDLDALGLAEACRNFCRQLQERTNLVVRTNLARFAQRFPPATELNLFRIVQEALNNVEKHARAKTVRLQIAVQRGSLLLIIQDDGRGFDPAVAKLARRKGEGVGLANIRERAAILGGTCEIESMPNRGTTVTVRVPAEDHGTRGPVTMDQ